MKYFHQLLTFFLASFLLISFVMAVPQPQKSVIISFPKDTPLNILEQAKEAVRAAGGFITHEYTIIKAFACTGPAKAFETVHELTSAYNPNIEDDQVVSIAGSS
ncbi:hypothetical protein EJ08DRAFT_654464 [Tothia fuscella]|uniref:Proteinase inhibitor, propeptide n=1 Tax=Tothia fuscella TaxID=1048955 RepID=A0A9P4NEW8_9PEZI|nr:hypothetical protein EJ08DRAFT_654464 [Tothia fuscella]